jgi:hypothetical protein
VQGKLFFLSTLNVMILQTVRNECVRFGGHVDIEVRYKILQLDILNKDFNFAQFILFWIGAVLRLFWWKTPLEL